MKEYCIFRAQFAGDMWRVMESAVEDDGGQYSYRILNKRRVVEKLKWFNGQRAIERCVVLALGCGVDIYWGVVS